MKKLAKIFCCNITLLLLAVLFVGCTDGTNEGMKVEPLENDFSLESEEKTDETEEIGLMDKGEDVREPTTESVKDDSNEIVSEETRNDKSNNTYKSEEDNSLSAYSSEKIEYARVWLQLGPNQEIDELNVRHIPAGTPLDPNDDTSISYPEDVTQLTGGRLIDGIVTYSGNGDGTINVYNVPIRWYGGFPPPENLDIDKIREQMKDIIKNTERVYVDPGDDEKVIELIKLIKVQ